MRNGRAPAGFQPKGWPMWLQTRCPNSTFETAKSMEVPVVGTHATRQSPMDSSRQTGAQTAPSKPLKAWRYRWWAHMRNGRAPAGFQPKGWPIVAADEVPKHAFETAKSMEVPVVGTHAKRQSPSRIPAQPAKDRRPDRGLTYPLNPSNSCRKPSKTHLLGSHKIGTKSSRTDGSNGRTRKAKAQKAGFQPKGWPIVAADEVPKHAFETAKSMEAPVVGTHPKRQSPSRIPAQPAKDRRPDRGLTYPLNPSNSCRKPSKTHLLGSHKIGTKSSRTDGSNGRTRKAKAQKAGFQPKGWPDRCEVPKQRLRNRKKHGGTGGGHACETAEPQQDSSPTRQRQTARQGPNVPFEPLKLL